MRQKIVYLARGGDRRSAIHLLLSPRSWSCREGEECYLSRHLSSERFLWVVEEVAEGYPCMSFSLDSRAGKRKAYSRLERWLRCVADRYWTKDCDPRGRGVKAQRGHRQCFCFSPLRWAGLRGV